MAESTCMMSQGYQVEEKTIVRMTAKAWSSRWFCAHTNRAAAMGSITTLHAQQRRRTLAIGGQMVSRHHAPRTHGLCTWVQPDFFSKCRPATATGHLSSLYVRARTNEHDGWCPKRNMPKKRMARGLRLTEFGSSWTCVCTVQRARGMACRCWDAAGTRARRLSCS
jgi:hypothetical protein